MSLPSPSFVPWNQGRIDGLVRRQVQQLAIGSIDTDTDTGGGADGFQQALIVRVNSAPRHRVELQLDGGQAGTGLATVQVQVQAGTTGDAAARGAAQRVDADLAKVYVDGLVARSTANGGAGTTSDAASGRGDFTFEIDGAVCRHGIADDQAGYCGSQNAFHGNGHD